MGSMHELRDEMKRADISMRYEDGGKSEVYLTGGKKVIVPAGTSKEDIKAAILEALK
jgi:hypothetical protein